MGDILRSILKISPTTAVPRPLVGFANILPARMVGTASAPFPLVATPCALNPLHTNHYAVAVPYESSPYNEFTDDERKLLNQFSRAAWGHPELFLKTYVSPVAGAIEFIDLGEYLAAFRLLFVGIVDHPTIFVREEYHVALDVLHGAQYRRGAVVTGQPGIGKTLFLVYLIVHFLGQKRAVALQFSDFPLRYAFFSEEGVSLQPSDPSSPLLNYPSSVWVPCDSNYATMIPHPTFLSRPDHLRVIQTISPEASRWREWSKQVGARRFVMDVWSEEEVKKLAILLQLNVEHMTECSKKWGGVPRTLLGYYFTPDDVVEEEYRTLAPAAVREHQMMLQRGAQCDFPDTASSSFYFVRPHKTLRDGKPRLVVPTRTLCCFLAEGLQQEDEAIKLQFFKALSQLAETRMAAGFIFESWFHSFFSTEDKEMQCQWITSRTQAGARQKLPSTTAVISATQAAPSSWTLPLYWVPPSRNFPGIDSALAMQVTIAKKRHTSSPADGLSELRKLLPNKLKNLPYLLVFVGTDKDHVETFANKYTSKIFFPTKGTCVRVGWSVVNPVQKHVIFKQFFSEGDLTPEELMEVEQ